MGCVDSSRIRDCCAIAAWLNAFALPEMALAFLAGLIAWQLYVGASLRRFAGSLRPPVDPEGVRAAFAEAFDDPSLAIVYPVAEDRWADAAGRPVDAPAAGDGRSVTDLRDAGGNVVAALIHDDALQDESAFINAVGAYATLTLENHRLEAEVSNLARQMRETQARAAASADHTRQELERDLHDGAQQRLIALRIKLQLAAEHSGDPAAETAERLNRLGAEVQRAIDEMRALAHGVFPPALVDFGPVEALRESVRSAPIPTTVKAANVRRYTLRGRAGRVLLLPGGTAERLQARVHGYRCAVTIATRGRQLAFEVADDGSRIRRGHHVGRCRAAKHARPPCRGRRIPHDRLYPRARDTHHRRDTTERSVKRRHAERDRCWLPPGPRTPGATWAAGLRVSNALRPTSCRTTVSCTVITTRSSCRRIAATGSWRIRRFGITRFGRGRGQTRPRISSLDASVGGAVSVALTYRRREENRDGSHVNRHLPGDRHLSPLADRGRTEDRAGAVLRGHRRDRRATKALIVRKMLITAGVTRRHPHRPGRAVGETASFLDRIALDRRRHHPRDHRRYDGARVRGSATQCGH